MPSVRADASDPQHPEMRRMRSALQKLTERKLVQWLLAYVAGAWVVLQILDVLAGPLNLSHRFQQGVLLLLVIGVPVVLVLAWYHGEQGRQRVGGVELLIIAGILGSAGIALALLPAGDGRETTGANTTRAERDGLTVAVLPFTDLGPDAESEYFGTAMTEELIGMLSRIEGVQVKSRTSVRRFKETEMDVAEIAAELGVDYVVEGGIRKADDRVRITVQLTEASSGFEEWSDIFDGESRDWFALHEELALEIAEALDIHLTPGEAAAIRAHYTDDEEAYDAFWRGWVLLESFHADIRHPEQKLVTAEGHFQDALALDPDYPLALAGLSVANSYYYFYGVDRREERRERAEALAWRALAIEDRLAEAHVALGLAHDSRGAHVTAVDEYREALSLDRDNAMVWCLLAFSCNWRDPPDVHAAEEAARESIRIDPTWFYSYLALGRALVLQDRYAEAAEVFEQGTQLNPAFRSMQYNLGRARLELGQYERALAAFEKARNLSESGEILVYIGAAHAGLGDPERALASLERGLAQGFDELDALEGSPYFATLRDDPRFQALLEEYEGTSF